MVKFEFFLLINFNLQLIYSFYLPKENFHNITTINSFSFGSCYNGIYQHASKFEIFDVIDKNKPDLFIWTGDAAYIRYADKTLLNKISNFLTIRDSEFNSSLVESKFNSTKLNNYYSKFNSKYPVIGIWDDNDYGKNDGNKHFVYKEEMKHYFLNFLDEPANSLRREFNRGIYETYSFGNSDSHGTIRIILLDVRFHKSSINSNDQDMLGDEQWQWLENIFKNSNESFIFIISGTQFLPIDRLVTECWFPQSRKKLFDLIAKTRKNGVLLITGDIHNGQILRTPCIVESIGYRIYEITSSGLGHYCTKNCNILIDYLLPSYYKFSRTITDYNFGKVDINWGDDLSQTKITLSLIDINGVVRNQYTFDYSEFTNVNLKSENMINSTSDKDECLIKIMRRFKNIKEYYEFYINPQNFIFIFVYFLFFFIGVTILYLIWMCWKGYLYFANNWKNVLHKSKKE